MNNTMQEQPEIQKRARRLQKTWKKTSEKMEIKEDTGGMQRSWRKGCPVEKYIQVIYKV